MISVNVIVRHCTPPAEVVRCHTCKVNIISYDDGYEPAKAVEVTRALVEEPSSP